MYQPYSPLELCSVARKKGKLLFLKRLNPEPYNSKTRNRRNTAMLRIPDQRRAFRPFKTAKQIPNSPTNPKPQIPHFTPKSTSHASFFNPDSNPEFPLNQLGKPPCRSPQSKPPLTPIISPITNLLFPPSFQPQGKKTRLKSVFFSFSFYALRDNISSYFSVERR